MVKGLQLFYSVFPGYSREALINLFVPDVALIRGRRLIEGRAYLSKYGSQEYLASEKSVLVSGSNLSLATGLTS